MIHSLFKMNLNPVAFSIAIAMLLLIGAFLKAPLAAAPLPGSASPGGVDPSRIDVRKVPRQKQKVFFVPPVNDRPLDKSKGERLIVRTFSVRGVIDRPEYGIYAKDIDAMVERLRVNKQKLSGDTVAGFSPGALAESAKILRELVNRREKEQITEQDSREIQLLIDQLKDVEYNQGLTIGQLQEVVNEVSNYYRSRGFILAQAYIPTQTVNEGIVYIQILEGTLGNLLVKNNSRYSKALISEPFKDLVGQPVVKQPTESALLRLTDYSGLNAFGVFRPGSNIGSTDLVINVQDEREYDMSTRLDNYGSEFSGDIRLNLDYAINNFSQVGDRLFGNLLRTFDPTPDSNEGGGGSGVFGSLSYVRPVFGLKNQFGINYSRNIYDLKGDLSALNLNGVTEVGSMFVRRSFTRKRQINRYGLIELNRKKAEVRNLGGAGSDSADKVAVVSLEYGFDSVSAKTSSVNTGFFRYSHGFNGLLSIEEDINPNDMVTQNADIDFNKVNLGYSRMQSFSSENSLLFTSRFQFSQDNLVSIERMGLGGPGSVRGYPVSEYLADKGFFFSLEWIMKAPGASQLEAYPNHTWGDVMQVSIFLDAARGKLNNPAAGESESETFKGGGIAFQLKWKQFFTRLEIAVPMGEKDENLDHSQSYLEVRYAF